MYFLEGSHLSYPELNNCCVKLLFQDTYCVEYLYNDICQKNPEKLSK